MTMHTLGLVNTSSPRSDYWVDDVYAGRPISVHIQASVDWQSSRQHIRNYSSLYFCRELFFSKANFWRSNCNNTSGKGIILATICIQIHENPDHLLWIDLQNVVNAFRNGFKIPAGGNFCYFITISKSTSNITK